MLAAVAATVLLPLERARKALADKWPLDSVRKAEAKVEARVGPQIHALRDRTAKALHGWR